MLKTKIHRIKYILSLIIAISCSSAYALPNSFYYLNWSPVIDWPSPSADNNIKISYLLRDTSGTRRVCPEYRYAVILLSGTVQDPLVSTGIQTIINDSKIIGSEQKQMYDLMENFANNCALVVLPEPRDEVGNSKSWDWAANSQDSKIIKNMINYIHTSLSLDTVLIGGSAGAVMAHNIALQSILFPSEIVGLKGLIIADGLSSVAGCASGNDCDQNGNRTSTRIHMENAVKAGTPVPQPWSLNTLMIASYEGDNSKVPSKYKREFAENLCKASKGEFNKENFLCEASSTGTKFIYEEPEGAKEHKPWKEGFQYIKSFLKDTLNVDDN